MALFLTDIEREAILASDDPTLLNLKDVLIRRVMMRSASPGMADDSTTTGWYHHAAEYMSDAAMAYALTQDKDLGRWIRAMVLQMVRLGQDVWIGPAFRDHEIKPAVGHLETAHLCLAVVSCADLAADAYTPEELGEIGSFLRETALPLCRNWLDMAERLNNWRCLLAAGLALCAAYLDDRAAMDRAGEEFLLCRDIFQEDGSHAESIQYGNYAAWGLMLTYEALVRRDPAYLERLNPDRYGRKVHWDWHSHLYYKPLDGWGPSERPRAVNFNDAAALYRPGGDLLLHIAVRSGEKDTASLASHLFDLHYGTDKDLLQPPRDLASLGMYNDFGFLSLPLFSGRAKGKSPAQLGLAGTRYFSNGDFICRTGEDGKETVLAIRTAGEELYGPSHLHGDLNSFVLIRNRERLLIDPGHSCYRNQLHRIDMASESHNTCTFIVGNDHGGKDKRQEDMFKLSLLKQDSSLLRPYKRKGTNPPVRRGGGVTLNEMRHGYRWFSAEAAPVYGPPVTRFERTWVVKGQVLFVMDRIESSEPVRTVWNWHLNNRDGRLEARREGENTLRIKRNGQGLVIFHCRPDREPASLAGPFYGHVHDMYHPEPGQRGEGRPGSGHIYRWTEREAALSRRVIHVFITDTAAGVDRWECLRDGRELVCLKKGRKDRIGLSL